ncbi:hypothetical protein [Qipengyuania marisflavi]|uniref:Uncharacterized protein n=1 Tax=Qipengyuania marisflavi TaxID=2486356 RepID=A0A5S3P0H3_9SPHN|nr:hypothetical protein [Qipengyuania marisflavi]TMM46222.1 hypothetical protein FEV51_11495 [Qipengyuania marisflavi]
MDPEFIVILVFVVAMTAIVLGIGNEIFRRHLEHKEKTMEMMADKTAQQAAQYAAKAEKLEQRVRVLERIATDRGQDLAMEIEDLRERPAEGESVQ